MKTFEYIAEDGKTCMNYSRWHDWRSMNDMANPPATGKFRYDVELTHPCDHLGAVPIDRNPHAFHGTLSLGYHLTGRTCFYSCADWFPKFGVYNAHHPSGESLRMVVENGYEESRQHGGHQERIRLMATSSSLDPEPWGMNPSNRFAFFRGKFWKVSNFERMHDWESGRGKGYPLTNQPGPWTKHPLGMPPELLFQETESFTRYPQAPGQDVTILYESPDWNFARWSPVEDLFNPINLGICYFVVWRHFSEKTGEHRFLSVTPLPDQGFPSMFCSTPDFGRGIFVPMEDGSTNYELERIAPGMERCRTIHFRLVAPVGPFPPQPKAKPTPARVGRS